MLNSGTEIHFQDLKGSTDHGACGATKVDASSQRDLREASVYSSFMLPKLYMKMLYCAELRGDAVKDKRQRKVYKRTDTTEIAVEVAWSLTCFQDETENQINALLGVSCAIHGRVVRVRNKVLRASPEGQQPSDKGSRRLRCDLLQSTWREWSDGCLQMQLMRNPGAVKQPCGRSRVQAAAEGAAGQEGAAERVFRSGISAWDVRCTPRTCSFA